MKIPTNKIMRATEIFIYVCTMYMKTYKNRFSKTKSGYQNVVVNPTHQDKFVVRIVFFPSIVIQKLSRVYHLIIQHQLFDVLTLKTVLNGTSI